MCLIFILVIVYLITSIVSIFGNVERNEQTEMKDSELIKERVIQFTFGVEWSAYADNFMLSIIGFVVWLESKRISTLCNNFESSLFEL